jgi:hypothetical protein
MGRAPILLFAYNRPELLLGTLRSLTSNSGASESQLFVYCDGPKANASSADLSRIVEVRKIVRSQKWCGTVEVIESPVNKGLAGSVISGVTEVINRFGTVIVVEDDVLLSPHFLNYMNAALKAYANDEKVFAVGSWTYFTRRDFKDEPFFFRFPDSIAWGTFKRSWDKFEYDGKEILRKLEERSLKQTFNGFRNLDYFLPMLKLQMQGKVDSWAIRWTATAILNEGLSVFPPVSMVRHMGFTKDSTHERGTPDYNEDLPLSEKEITKMPKVFREYPGALSDWRNFILRNFLDSNSTKRKYLNRVKEAMPSFMYDLIFS